MRPGLCTLNVQQRHLSNLYGDTFPTARGIPLNNKIHQLRKERRWTLTHLASLSGVPYNTIWRMERGSGTAVTQAYKVAAAFQLTVYDLWSIPPSGTIPLENEVEVFSVTELRLKRGWRLRDLAELSRVSTTTLFAIEKGRIPKK